VAIGVLAASCAALLGSRALTAARRPEAPVLAAALLAEIPLYKDLPGLPVCIALDPGLARQSASREFVAALKVPGRRIVRAAECEVRATDAIEIATQAPALFLVAGPVEWVSDEEAWVTTTYVKTRAQSIGKQYEVISEDGQRWRALGPVWRGMPN
jgi:hypothetical protein